MATSRARPSATGCVPVYGPQCHKFDPRLDPTKSVQARPVVVSLFSPNWLGNLCPKAKKCGGDVSRSAGG
ncbi:unnamed protein product [Caenorhabditis auriculariae]|uniref:Uncharacterized protein n=1 Tax=Caenorhabditis auriculariae TaxID=2777116 RepID=A0A8S1GRX4_9PELO|nr:unnamed protein product [Caenorhabditis auriculariae]